jgi:hypothetical protein
MKNETLTTLLLALLVLGGCSFISDYEECIEIETKNIRSTDIEKLGIAMENAQMRAENICYKEPVNFLNEEEILRSIMEEESCINMHVQKFLPKPSRSAESRANDLCTMRILDDDIDLSVK